MSRANCAVTCHILLYINYFKGRVEEGVLFVCLFSLPSLRLISLIDLCKSTSIKSHHNKTLVTKTTKTRSQHRQSCKSMSAESGYKKRSLSLSLTLSLSLSLTHKHRNCFPSFLGYTHFFFLSFFLSSNSLNQSNTFVFPNHLSLSLSLSLSPSVSISVSHRCSIWESFFPLLPSYC